MIDQKEIQNYLKSEITQQIEKNKSEISLKEFKFTNTYDYYDYLFPFHIFMSSGDKIQDSEFEYNLTYRYLAKLRYEMVHLLNNKYQKFMNNNDREEIKKLENRHFIVSSAFYLSSFSLMYFKPIKRPKILNYYFGAYLFLVGYLNSILVIKNDLINLRNKIRIKSKPFNKNEKYIYDYTVIPDWRTYLYYYKYL
jgi:hypothetical protein